MYGLGDVWVLDLKTNSWTSVVPVASGTLLRQGGAMEYVPATDALFFETNPCPLKAALALRDAGLAAQFQDGLFATLYLSPKDYHRVHMPWAGTLVGLLFTQVDYYVGFQAGLKGFTAAGPMRTRCVARAISSKGSHAG